MERRRKKRKKTSKRHELQQRGRGVFQSAVDEGRGLTAAREAFVSIVTDRCPVSRLTRGHCRSHQDNNRTADPSDADLHLYLTKTPRQGGGAMRMSACRSHVL